MKTRFATLDDVPNLCALLKLLFEQEAEFRADAMRQAAGLRLILENPVYGHIIVGCVEGEIVGMVSILYTVSTFMGQKVAILEDMVVSPEHRGKGFGNLILAAAILQARDGGCGRVTLLTDSVNYSAIKFYERSGFTKSTMTPFRLVLDENQTA
jgi:GNAT superfamily N-acetyltransferase